MENSVDFSSPGAAIVPPGTMKAYLREEFSNRLCIVDSLGDGKNDVMSPFFIRPIAN